jgi:hypothetical protein
MFPLLLGCSAPESAYDLRDPRVHEDQIHLLSPACPTPPHLTVGSKGTRIVPPITAPVALANADATLGLRSHQLGRGSLDALFVDRDPPPRPAQHVGCPHTISLQTGHSRRRTRLRTPQGRPHGLTDRALAGPRHRSDPERVEQLGAQAPACARRVLDRRQRLLAPRTHIDRTTAAALVEPDPHPACPRRTRRAPA